MNTSDVAGPVDFLILEFDPAKTDGSVAAAMVDLIDGGTIRLYDFAVVVKTEAGEVSAVEIADTGEGLGVFAAFAGAQSGLLGDDDVAEAGEAIAPGRAAALFVYENTWAIPFIAAARASDAEVVASARIPSDVIVATLDELDAADA